MSDDPGRLLAFRARFNRLSPFQQLVVIAFVLGWTLPFLGALLSLLVGGEP